MPIRNNRIYCINHPDEELISANEQPEWDHFVLLAKQRPDQKMYDILQKGTAMIFHACPICGYAEPYLTKDEIDNLKKGV